MDIYNPEDGFVIAIGIFTFFGMWPSSIKLPTLRLYIFLYSTYKFDRKKNLFKKKIFSQAILQYL